MGYCPTPLFPVTHSTEASTNANVKSHHGAFMDDYNYSTANGNANYNQAQQTSWQTQTNPKATRKSASSQKRNQASKADATPMNTSYNEFASAPTNCDGTMMHNVNGVCMPNGPTNVTRSSVSRCSSVASNHQMQQQQQQPQQQQPQQHSNDSYSYNYSPATTNISAHSPY